MKAFLAIKPLRILLLSMAGGIILTLIRVFVISEWSQRAPDAFISGTPFAFKIGLSALCVALFFLCGFVFLSDMNRREILISAGVMAAYTAAYLLLERFALVGDGALFSIIIGAFVPISVYSDIWELLDFPIWLQMPLTAGTPFLYILFARAKVK